MKRRVLVTGFEPFGEDTVNPSYEAVRRLPDRVGGAEILKLRLPVVFGEAADLLERIIQQEHPEIVLCVGLAGGRSAITPERRTVNILEARIPDNKGRQPREEKILEDGEPVLDTGLPVREMVSRMREEGIPAELSDSAGTFVCNEVFYRLLRLAQTCALRGGFIHVPFMTGMRDGQPEMDLEDIVRGLRICVEAAVADGRGLQRNGSGDGKPAGRERGGTNMWKCPKCGRTFKKENQDHYCGKAPETVDDYIFAQDEEIRGKLQDVRGVLIDRLPGAAEKISWSMPTYWKDGNILHFAAQKKHIGLYPGPEAVEHFADKLEQAGLKYSKGSIRIPYSGELPLELIGEIAAWCRETGNHA